MLERNLEVGICRGAASVRSCVMASSSTPAATKNNVRVAVRVRPLLPFEKNHPTGCISVDSRNKRIVFRDSALQSGTEKQFTFDHIIDESASQVDMFTTVGIPAMLDSVLEGLAHFF